jgi:hypothetical protein
MCILFVTYSPSYLLSPSPPPFHWCQPFLFPGRAYFVEEKTEKIKKK